MHSPGGRGSKNTLTLDIVGPQVNHPAWLSLPGCKLGRLHVAVTTVPAHSTVLSQGMSHSPVPRVLEGTEVQRYTDH